MVTEITQYGQPLQNLAQQPSNNALKLPSELTHFFPLAAGTKEPIQGMRWREVKPGQYQPIGSYGIALQAHCLVIDADPRNYPAGRNCLAEILDGFPELRNTFWVSTPSGGYHLYLKKPADLEVKKHQSNYPGIDFLSYGHYVVGPGTELSPGPNRTVGVYRVGSVVELAEASEAFLAHLEEKSAAIIGPTGEESLSMEAQFKTLCEIEKPATKGERGIRTFKLAAKARDLGLPQDTAFDHIRALWNMRNLPPEIDSELFKSVSHAYKYARNSFGVENVDSKFAAVYDPSMVPITCSLDAEKQRTKPGAKASQSTKALWCAGDLNLWRESNGTAYATVEIAGRVENPKLDSKIFKAWLSHRYFKEYGSALSSTAIKETIDTLSARAVCDRSEIHQAETRVASANGLYYLDLCNSSGQGVEIGPSGWQVVSSCPIKFTRPAEALASPTPTNGGTDALEAFRRLFNISDRQSWALIKSYLLACLRPGVPVPIMVLTGEQGSGKTSLARAIRKIIDPHNLPLRGAPRSEQDILIALKNGYMVCFDNLSSIDRALSDTLCRISTGGGNGYRTHYENDQETIFSTMRPIMVTSIADVVASYADLQSRSLMVRVEPISNAQRVTEQDLWKSFDALLPEILGALLTAFSSALSKLESTNLSELPRMADFVRLGVAAEEALGLVPGEFLEAFGANQLIAAEQAIDASPVGSTIMGLAKPWIGTKTQLLDLIKFGQHFRHVPDNTKQLTDQMNRVLPALKQLGVEIADLPRSSSARTIQITGKQTGTTLQLVPGNPHSTLPHPQNAGAP